MQEAKRAAARRGELRLPLPIGYAYDIDDQVVLDPDQEVQAAVADVFRAFETTGSCCGVVTRTEQQALLRFGEPPSPVSEPLAELLFRWIDSRDNMNTAANHASQWLFPGRRAGQPLHPDVLAALLNDLGIPTTPTAGRTAAIRQHVLEMPAPVAAEALGYHRVTTAKLASEAGGTWSRYASGDHWR